jgi:hypothetical protein
MSPAVLLVLISMSSGAAGLEIDMPSLDVCQREMQRFNEQYHVDSSARCVDRREQWPPGTRHGGGQ